MGHDEVVAKISELVRSQYHVEIEDFSADMLEGLGLDSLDLTEMMFTLEDMFGVDIPINDLYGVRTMNDIADVIVAKLPQPSRPVAQVRENLDI